MGSSLRTTPDVVLQPFLQDHPRKLSDYRGKPLIINVWASWRNSSTSVRQSSCLQQNGIIPKNCRRQYGVRVPEATFALIERITREKLNQFE
jgi:Tfp pilus assembly protein PilX